MHIKRAILFLVIIALSLSIISSHVWGVEEKYKDYKYSRKQIDYYQITISKKNIDITVFDDGSTRTDSYRNSDITIANNAILASGDPIFDSRGLLMGENVYPFDRITDVRIMGDEREYTISFLTSDQIPDAAGVKRRGNIVSFDENIEVGDNDFVRGVIYSVKGDIDIYGEVNRDIVSLFGEIYIAPGAVARGDIATVKGRIDAARDGSIYGEMYSPKKRKQSQRRHRFSRGEKETDLSGQFIYNRVDGATPYLSLKFTDQDSLLPSVWAHGGYAFASERERFELGLEQTIVRSVPLTVGGRYYRSLKSEDDWLLTKGENTLYALFAKEDFMDYYEAEGGEIYINFKPLETIKFNGGYRIEETKWLKAHYNLWYFGAIFGGDKEFSRNFERVHEPFRTSGTEEIDSLRNRAFFASLTFDTRREENVFRRSSWFVKGDFEWSTPDLDSDYDYRRYSIRAVRYEKITRHTMLISRFMYGGSDGYLPMYKRFYLGGLGTLRGYKHKEYLGTRFWMANAEYRLKIPRSDIALGLFYDAGQIANETKLTSDIEIKQNIGVSVYFGEDVKINIARRLDRSDVDKPQVYVRLEHHI